MKKYLLVLLVVMLSCGLQSCSSSEDVDDLETKKVNMLPKAQPIQLTEAQRVFASDNNSFTLNFLKTVNETDKSGKSFIYSPLSITYVLGMVNDAATGTTEKELEQTLGFHQGGIKAVNNYCKKLIDGLPKVDSKVTLNIANALFVNQNEATLKTQYQHDMQQYYNAMAENLDFNSPSALGTINEWANDHTNGMIPNILDKIDPNVLTYLLNAIYFKADWASKFDQVNTKTETFTTESGSAKLPLMHQKVLIEYMNNGQYSAVKIPYGNGMWNMMVLLPENGNNIDFIINRLAAYGLNGVEGTLCETTDESAKMRECHFTPYEVDLKLPRFETKSDTDELDIDGGLVGLMQKMGVHLAFDQYFAEIPNMCEKPAYISMMRQKAAIKVNEEGSEAAAVTIAGTFELCTADPVEYPQASFHANRPFVYVISEASSGVILFVGKFMG